MSDEINRTADWAPGTLDKTRKNIGDLSANEAASMAKKLGGQVMYERTESSGANSSKNTGRIVRGSGGSSGGSSSGSGRSGGGSSSSDDNLSSITSRRYVREDLPNIPKKVNVMMDKLMMSPDYKIKPNYGFFNFVRSFQKNGMEKISPDFYDYAMKQMIDHIESFMTVIKTLIQMAPATYKSKIASGTEVKFKFLRMVAGWTLQGIKQEYVHIQDAPKPYVTADLIPFVRAIYKPLVTVYYYGNNKIPKLVKEIYADEAAYPDAPKDKLSQMAKEAITEWLYIDSEIIKKLYPLLMRMTSDTYEQYPGFFNAKVGNILKFLGLHKFDLLLPEKPKEEAPKEQKKKVQPPQKGVKDSTVLTGIKLLDQLFPEAGFNKLDEHPDLYPYFQPMYKYDDGFNMLSPENPIQTIVVLQRIIEDCFQGCRNMKFMEQDAQKKDSESMQNILNEWSAYREDSFERLYCPPLIDLVNSIYSQADFEKSHIGKRTINSLLWQVTYHFLPNFKFDQLILEHPTDESKYRPMFHRTDFARKYLTVVVNQCDVAAKTKGNVPLLENPWEHYRFDVPNEVSKRLDVLLGGQNKGANTTANNANLLKYTLCFIAVLDWYLNNPDSPAYTSDPMNIYRISESDGKPVFSVEVRNDQNKLFADAIRASYQQKAQ